MAIPKIIHYCWFGDGQIPEENQAYIDEWKTVCPDYQIIKWNESNYDVNKVAFMREAAAARNWTFIADYARFDIINTYGGIYLDVDVQVLRSYDQLLEFSSFWGIEQDYDRQLYVNPGLGFGSIPDNPILKQLLDFYSHMHFENENVVASPILLRKLFEQYGFEQKNKLQKLEFGTLFPKEYFAPLNSIGKLKTTNNTISIHHYLGSWITNPYNRETLLFKKCVYYFGQKPGEYIFQAIKRIKNIGR